MLNLFRKQRGAVSVFLVIILVPIIVVTAIFVDAGRVRLAQGVVSSAGDLTLNTALTQYDAKLNEYYGLMASAQNIKEFLDVANDYFEVCISSRGIDTTDAAKYANQISGLLNGEQEVDDLLQIQLPEGEEAVVGAVKDGSLENPALVKKEIVEFMKYRSPINKVADLLSLFQDSASDLEDAEQNAEIVDKKKKHYEDEGAVCEKAHEVYQIVQKYIALDITKEEIEALKQAVQECEGKYKNIHIKIVKDLFNTGGAERFQKTDLQAKALTNPYTNENKADAGTIKNYMHNAADALGPYLDAKRTLENRSTLDYNESAHYGIQYWMEMMQRDYTSIYKTYEEKAKNLLNNFAMLSNAEEFAEDGALAEAYTLPHIRNDITSGTKLLSEHYAALEGQMEEIENDFKNDSLSYNSISATLQNISNSALDSGQISPDQTDGEIKNIYNQLNSCYKKLENGMKLIEQANEALKDLTSLAEKCVNSRAAWSSSANAGKSEFAGKEQEEVKATEPDSVTKNVTVESVSKMQGRMNNIKSLLGNVLSGIHEFQYNGTPVYTLDSYQAVKNASGIDANRITYMKAELDAYANSSFKFTKSDKLANSGITDNNNPALHQVNTPKLYEWMKKKFEGYNDEKSKDEKKKHKENEKEGDDYLKNNKTESQSGSKEELVKEAGRPSEAYAENQDKSEVTSSITKVSEFVSGLFTNFGSTVNSAATNVRDDLYVTDYIMSMLSYDTFENEGKYELLSDQQKKDVSLTTANQVYQLKEKEWKDTDVEISYNKTLTNKMIDSSNNFSYLNEAEYILYGGTNLKNKASSYGSIFMMRFALNLPADFTEFWGNGALNTAAMAAQLATCGVIPAPLFKIIVILGLTAAEAACDLKYLQSGIPVVLLKGKEDLFIDMNFVEKPKGDSKKPAFQYSDYISLLLFLKLLDSDKANGIYARTADVVQANMKHKIVKKDFLLKNSQIYFKLNAKAKVPPLLLDIPLTADTAGNPKDNETWYTISYESIRGY